MPYTQEVRPCLRDSFQKIHQYPLIRPASFRIRPKSLDRVNERGGVETYPFPPWLLILFQCRAQVFGLLKGCFIEKNLSQSLFLGLTKITKTGLEFAILVRVILLETFDTSQVQHIFGHQEVMGTLDSTFWKKTPLEN